MKLIGPVWDVGFELEFFLTDGKRGVYNAHKVMTKELGFSIDQNNPRAGCLGLGEGFTLKTDGTAMELQWFDRYNKGRIPTFIDRKLQSVSTLRKFNNWFTPFVKDGEDKVHLIEPGTTYSSQKILWDAYRNTWCIPDKKDENTVTQRTAGLHLNFSIAEGLRNGKDISDMIFGSEYDPYVMQAHVSALVKILDDIYGETYSKDLSKESMLRCKHYQKLGEFRTREAWRNDTHMPTLEYRQLDCSMIDNVSQLNRFINQFQDKTREYLSAIPVRIPVNAHFASPIDLP